MKFKDQNEIDLEARERQRKADKEQRRVKAFLRNNDTDAFGNCFSDADPGL